MRITNKFGLPDAIVRAVHNDDYTKGDADYSISELISPARALLLTKRFDDQIESDVSDRINALFGKGIHKVAEMANAEGIAERRLHWTVLGKKISGAMDYYNPKEGALTDYKTSSIYKFKYQDFEDWEWQQNCYAQLLRWHNEPIKSLSITVFWKDYRPGEHREAQRKGDPYPDRAGVIPLTLWDEKTAIRFIEDRVRAHEAAKLNLPLCTPEERKVRGTTFKIKKSISSKAETGHAYYISRETAEAVLRKLERSDLRVFEVPGVNARCESFCDAVEFCDQYKEMQGVSSNANHERVRA